VRTPPRMVPPLLLAGLLLVGCGGADDGAIEDPMEAEPGQDSGADGAEDAGDPPAGDVPDDLAATADEVVVEVAEEEGVDVEAVTIVTAEEVTWSDGALGCPEEGGIYTQALVEGYRIVVEVEGREVHYHGALGEAPFRCDDPQPPAAD
jgi:hypothetical protein